MFMIKSGGESGKAVPEFSPGTGENKKAAEAA